MSPGSIADGNPDFGRYSTPTKSANLAIFYVELSLDDADQPHSRRLSADIEQDDCTLKGVPLGPDSGPAAMDKAKASVAAM